MKQELDWQVVDSSNVREVAYDEDDAILGVVFNNGGVYAYIGVQPDDYHSLVGAESVGKYLNNVIKVMYPYQKFQSKEDLVLSL